MTLPAPSLTTTPSRTADFQPIVTASSTGPHNRPRTTPPPSSDGSPTEVVVQLTTTFIIPDYLLYYDVPFNPQYNVLADGSLIASPYRSDLAQANIFLLLLSVLGTMFLRNVLVSGNYIRSAKVRRKGLFRTVFFSQLIAFVGLVPAIVSYLSSNLNCSSVILAADIAATVSIILLMTGVLGVKVYKCLDNSVFVLFALAALTIGAIVVSILDFIALKATLRLSGSCTRTDDMRWSRIFIVLQLAQSLFTCCCFLYAVWKSRNSPVARDRISIRLSMGDFQEQEPNEKQGLRAWWERIAKPHNGAASSSTSSYYSDSSRRRSEVVSSAETHLLGSYSIREETSTPQPLQSGESDRAAQAERNGAFRPLSGDSSAPGASLAPSTFSRISRYLPGMELFRKVMQDELCYTSLIMVCCVVVAVIAVVGASSRGHLWLLGWIGFYWAVASTLVMHGLGRAVRRHERETLFQKAALHQKRWEEDRSRARHYNLTSNRNIRRFSGPEYEGTENPFGDTRALNTASWNSGVFPSSASPSSPRSITLDRRSSLPICPSPAAQFPASGRTTPLVPLDTTRAALPGVGFVIDSDYSLKRAGSGS